MASQKVLKRLSTVFTFLFLIGVVFVAYFLFELPEKLVRTVNAIDHNNLNQAYSALNEIYIVIGLVLAFGLGVITINLLGRKSEEDLKQDKASTQSLEDEELAEEEDEEVDVEQLANESKTLVTELNALVKGKSNKQDKFDKVLSHICKHLEASQGVIYLNAKISNKNGVKLFSTYAFAIGESEELGYELGEGIIGQVAKEGNPLIIDSVPEGHMEIFSGLGNASPTHLLVAPIKKNDKIIGVAEISSFKNFNSIDQQKIQDSLLVLGNISEDKSEVKTSKTAKSATSKTKESKGSRKE